MERIPCSPGRGEESMKGFLEKAKKALAMDKLGTKGAIGDAIIEIMMVVGTVILVVMIVIYMGAQFYNQSKANIALLDTNSQAFVNSGIQASFGMIPTTVGIIAIVVSVVLLSLALAALFSALGRRPGGGGGGVTM